MERSDIHRLAASYAPRGTRKAVETLLALEAQFAKFIFIASEPILAQMRLAWWRDRFSQDPGDWPNGNALLHDLADWGPQAAQLGALVDGWEALLAAPPLRMGDLDAYCAGRAAGWLALAQVCGVEVDPAMVRIAASRWAMADAAAALGKGKNADAARAHGLGIEGRARLPKALRPLTVLDAIGARSLRDQAAPMSRPGDLLAVLRRGLAGR